ncbi:hypothetical protein QJQ45_023367 [Haematococcus lacustris]|nr:hypothetical protein QJQ45_023367 [Haematococcus lacustris]
MLSLLPLLTQMTRGEAEDHRLKHNKQIEAALEAARAELALTRKKWVWDCYQDDSILLGRGAFARVFKGRIKATNRPVAIKMIARDNTHFDQQKRAMVTKVATMRTLQGHRSMVKLYEVFEDEQPSHHFDLNLKPMSILMLQGFHVVLEYMPALALFDAIVQKGHFTEADAATIMRQLLQFIAYMHNRNVVHRDIKPENLLLLKPHRPANLGDAAEGAKAGKGGDGEEEDMYLTQEEEREVDEAVWADIPDGLRLKVIDYGTANFCEAGQHLHSKIGTARYVAPEVLGRDYDKSSDIWSAGVVMFIMLVGHAPFKGTTDTGTLAKVKAGVYELSGPGWDEVSASAKDLLRHMLVVDTTQRWSAEELLEHLWFHEAGSATAATGGKGYLERLNGFAGMCRMKRLALKLMAAQEVVTLSTEEVTRLKEMFAKLDTDGDGLIDGKALHLGLEAVGCKLSEHDVAEFLAVSLVDSHRQGPVGGGLIDPNEFIAALFNNQAILAKRPGLVEEEFKRLDTDNDGYITAQDLVEASKAGGGAGSLLGESGEISLEEADDMLREMAGVGPRGATQRHSPKLRLGLNLADFKEMMTASKSGKLAHGRQSMDITRPLPPTPPVAASDIVLQNGSAGP